MIVIKHETRLLLQRFYTRTSCFAQFCFLQHNLHIKFQGFLRNCTDDAINISVTSFFFYSKKESQTYMYQLSLLWEKNTVRMAQVHFGYLIKMQPATVVQFYNKRREPVLLRHEIVRQTSLRRLIKDKVDRHYENKHKDNTSPYNKSSSLCKISSLCLPSQFDLEGALYLKYF